MRMVHDIDGFMSVSGGGNLYSIRKGKKKSAGFKVTILAETEPGQHWLVEHEVIHIEGDAKHVRQVLLDMIELIDDCGQMYVDDGQVIKNWKSLTKARKRADEHRQQMEINR